MPGCIQAPAGPGQEITVVSQLTCRTSVRCNPLYGMPYDFQTWRLGCCTGKSHFFFFFCNVLVQYLPLNIQLQDPEVYMWIKWHIRVTLATEMLNGNLSRLKQMSCWLLTPSVKCELERSPLLYMVRLKEVSFWHWNEMASVICSRPKFKQGLCKSGHCQ